MAFLSKVPGLVVDNPLRGSNRADFKQRSMVARLIVKSWVLMGSARMSSRCRSSTTSISGMKGFNRFEQIRPQISQMVVNA